MNIIFVMLGIIFGSIITGLMLWLRFSNGELRITETNEKDLYTIYIDDLERLLRRKYLILRINNSSRK